ncbi:MAG: hypothetical protein ABWZ79_06890 [Pedobacter agri]
MSYSKLSDLRNVFLEGNQQALRGKRHIDKLKDKQHKLGQLLRSHDDEPIYEDETYLRDDIDYFLEYFSILSLGHITGYLSLKDLEEDKTEILYYLGLEPLKAYYYEHYPLELPQILFEVLKEGRPFKKTRHSANSDNLFFKFHALNQTIDNDEVNQFLWFLDNGYTDNFNVRDLKDMLNDTKKCFKKRTEDSVLGQAISGFFMYLDFLELLDQFLKKPGNTSYRAAYWTYHAYWLSRIDKQLRASLKRFFNGLEDFLSHKEELSRQEVESSVGVSRRKYDAILDRLIYDHSYQEQFRDSLDKWRGKNRLSQLS